MGGFLAPASAPTASVSKKFIHLIDESKKRVSIMREAIIQYRDEGDLREVRYSDWTSHPPAIRVLKVLTSYEELNQELS